MSQTQYLVRTADGADYCRVEPWEGGESAARDAARRIGGYAVELDPVPEPGRHDLRRLPRASTVTTEPKETGHR